MRSFTITCNECGSSDAEISIEPDFYSDYGYGGETYDVQVKDTIVTCKACGNQEQLEETA